MLVRACAAAAAALLAVALLPQSAAATFAGKNGRIFFASNLAPTGFFTDIFSMTPRGTEVEPVRMLDDWQRDPAVSPNGRWVAFSSEPEQECCLTFWAMRTNGSHLMPMDEAPTFRRGGIVVWPHVAAGESPGNPTYSSDGTLIAWQQDDGTMNNPNWNIYVANSDGSGQRQLTDRAKDEVGPDFSPSGRRIVFAGATKASEMDIFDIRRDGTDMRRLTHGKAAERHHDVSQFLPDYSPNGKRIVYMQEAGENPDIFKMHADGSREHAVTQRFGFITEPDWAPKPRRR